MSYKNSIYHSMSVHTLFRHDNTGEPALEHAD